MEAKITKIVVSVKTKLHWQYSFNQVKWSFRCMYNDVFVTSFCVTLQVTSRMVTPGSVRLKRKYPSQWKVTRTSVQYSRNLLRKSLSTKESVLCSSKSLFICWHPLHFFLRLLLWLHIFPRFLLVKPFSGFRKDCNFFRARHRPVVFISSQNLAELYCFPVSFFDVKFSCYIINLSSRIGKTRRGDYSLSDSDGSAFKHTYNREALIDFPSEQRYRQLVNHYGQEKPSERSNTLPTRSRKKHEAKEKALEETLPVQTMKVGRVTVTAPTRVWRTWLSTLSHSYYGICVRTLLRILNDGC